jgi:FtsP/CotA-like multicopper oxidase with cupredoxin domain
MRLRHTVLIAAAIVLAIVGVGSAISHYSPRFFSSRSPVYRSVADSCTRPPGYAIIIADGTGFNGSKSHGAPVTPWPPIQVKRNETVSLLICNQDPIQAHGFVIDHYFDGGVVLNPGEAYKISFVASDAGAFRIFCYVFCTVHTYMSGQLRVTP